MRLLTPEQKKAFHFEVLVLDVVFSEVSVAVVAAAAAGVEEVAAAVVVVAVASSIRTVALAAGVVVKWHRPGLSGAYPNARPRNPIRLLSPDPPNAALKPGIRARSSCRLGGGAATVLRGVEDFVGFGFLAMSSLFFGGVGAWHDGLLRTRRTQNNWHERQSSS